MPTNGFLVSSTLAKSLVVSLIGIGIWVGTIQSTLGDKADSSTVDVAIATQTEVLKNINKTLVDIKASVKSLDDRQRKADIELAKLKAKAEAADE